MSAKHTPGPWTVRQSYGAERIIVQAPQPTNRVLAGFGSEDEPLDDTDVANARLIAAAPELLEAAKLVLAWHEAESDHSKKPDFYKSMDMCRASEDAIRAAIAKAIGA